MPRPSILYINSHDTGRYIEPYGYAVPTPALQRLAEEGVLFRQCFSGGPTCSPSRAALVTGRSPHSCGMIGLAHRGFSLSDYGQHIVTTLKNAGYETVLAGFQHVATDPAVIGYDRLLDRSGRGPEAAIDYLRSGPREPFYLEVGFRVTHRPFPEPGPEENERYVRPPAPIPDTPRTRHDMACYVASARRLDEHVNAVLTTLAETGLDGNTLVVCTTDHGIAWPGMKCTLTDHGLGVFLIMRGPGGFAGGRILDGLVSQIDLFPTLCDLLELDPPPWLEGTSIMPLVRGEAEEVNEEVFGEVTYHAAYEPQRCVRTRRWKYIRRFVDRESPVLAHCDDSPSKDVRLECGWADQRVAPEQLYDLVFDPNEAGNLADDPAHAAVLDEMRGRLRRWMERTGDPLLHGPVAAPTGGRVNSPDALSPGEPAETVGE